MTARISLAGDVSSALTHFATYGLAILVEEEIVGARVMISYTHDPQPRSVLEIGGVTEVDVAEAIRKVAIRWSLPDSWTQSVMEYPDGKKVESRSPFSPRIKAFGDRKTWVKHFAFRHDFLDRLSDDGLALQFINGLGEAAYWRKESNSPRPDDGASRWEMKTRNRGEEFVVHRFAGLATEVATWDPWQIVEGLKGRSVNDVIGKNNSDSRTSTGLTRPQPTDNALAFVALLGMGLMPPIPNVRGMSITPGAYPQHTIHPRLMILPVPSEYVTVERIRSIIYSAQLDVVARRILEGSVNDPELDEAERVWLKHRNIAALAVFPIFKGGSSSAPERQVLDGSLVIL
ncbi:hypothetical protein [Corynebacterium auriscanis]|uniref:hypothetical protein n=1 Tax=Corynebacterium auriscanis TaxID=99807 RepID=UPI003CEBAC73